MRCCAWRPHGSAAARAHAIRTPTVTVRSQSLPDSAAYHAERPAAPAASAITTAATCGVSATRSEWVPSSSLGLGAADAGGGDEHGAGLDAHLGEGAVGAQVFAEGGLEQRDRGHPGLVGVGPADVDGSRTDRHHEVEHADRTVHADRDRGGRAGRRAQSAPRRTLLPLASVHLDLRERPTLCRVVGRPRPTYHHGECPGIARGNTREHCTARRAAARRAGDAGRSDRPPAAAGAPGERGRQRRPDERDPDARQPRLHRPGRDHGRWRQPHPQLPRGRHVPLRHARLHHRADRPAA